MTTITDARPLDQYDIDLLSYSNDDLLFELECWRLNHRFPVNGSEIVVLSIDHAIYRTIVYIESILKERGVTIPEPRQPKAKRSRKAKTA